MKNMKKYHRYGIAEFEAKLRKSVYDSYLKKPLDITDDFSKENLTWERIYEIPTRNKAVSIIVFSSLDLRTDRTRDCGDDAVRVVMKWKTKNGDIYKKVGKHLRTLNLFSNLKKSLSKARDEAFKLKFSEFQKSYN